MSAQAFGIGLFVIAAIVGIFLFLGWLLMVLANIPLAQYGIEPLQYNSSLAIVAILAIFIGGGRSSKD